MKKTKFREVSRADFRAFLGTAKEYLESARDEFAKGRFIVACGNSVHAVIAASDALTIFFLGKKSAGPNHLDAVKLLKQIAPGDEELSRQLVRFQKVLGMKHAAEYDGGRVTQKDAEMSLKDAIRFMDFVKARLS